MPIYEYACGQCGHEFEALVRSETVPECPKCHATQLTKQLSVFATAAATAEPARMPSGGCGGCGQFDGRGGCALN